MSANRSLLCAVLRVVLQMPSLTIQGGALTTCQLQQQPCWTLYQATGAWQVAPGHQQQQ
jgi:hypothetical protein